MRSAETVLGVIRERGRRRLPLEDIYRQLYNPDLYLRAYGRIYRNDGAMTPGVTAGNRRCDVPGEDRADHRGLTVRALSMDTSPADLYPEEIGQLTPPGAPRLVGQSAPRRHTCHFGGVLRTAVQRARPWVPSWAWLSHGVEGDHDTLERREMVHRRRHQGLFRSCMLMPPSRTRKTCLRSNSAPRLAGENVQHVDMLGMSHSAYLYALKDTSYIIV